MNSRTPTWPYIAMVACLFLGSILATQTYRDPKPVEVIDFEFDAPLIHEPEVALVAPEVQPFTEEPVNARIELPLAEIAAPAAKARIAPPVADRVPTPLLDNEPQRIADDINTDLSLASSIRLARRGRSNPELASFHKLRRQALGQNPNPNTPWPYPRSLAEQIQSLSEYDEVADWSMDCLIALNNLTQAKSPQALEAGRTLRELRALGTDLQALAEPLAEPNRRRAMLRAAYALQRREMVWRAIHEITRANAATFNINDDGEGMSGCVDELQKFLTTRHSQEWSLYLGINETVGVIASANANSSDMQRHARMLLRRFAESELTAEQQEFMKSPEIGDYAAKLQTWANEPISYARLLRELEDFERLRDERSSQTLAASISALQWSDDPREQNLGAQLDTHYRNANIRITMSRKFVNRMVPTLESVHEQVDDFVVGAHVVGRSEASAELEVEFIPSPDQWQIQLDTRGFVASETTSTRGPVTTLQDGLSEYLVRKKLAVCPRQGILVSPAEAVAVSASDLVGLHTDFDGIPLLNLLARSIAIQQYGNYVLDAQWEVEDKVANKARRRVDEEIERRLVEINTKIEQSVLGPFNALELEPRVMDLQTHETQLVGRFRLSGSEQLAGFTPRPREPKTAMFSVQVHESAINNAINGMQLGGKRMEITELFRRITELTNAAEQPVPIPEEIPANVFVTFVDHDPVHVRLRDNQMRLSVDVKSLEAEGREWKDFGIDAYYKPSPNQVQANLVRDGVIEVRGHLSFRDRIPLRAIFGKVFNKNKAITLINDHLRNGVRLQGLQVDQFALEDGWLGLAIGPQLTADAKPAEASNSLR